jgi:alkylated DNA repair dioxygenase AlkB
MSSITWEVPQPVSWRDAGFKVFCETRVSKIGAKYPRIVHKLIGKGIIWLTPTSHLLLYDGFLTKESSEQILNELKSLDGLFESPSHTIYGRSYPIPRGQCAFGIGTYKYGDNDIKAHEPPSGIKALLTAIQSLMGDNSYQYVLANKYDDGNKKIGLHSDDERGLDAGAPIISYSLGTSRRFVIKPKKDPKKKIPANSRPLIDIFMPRDCPGVLNERNDLDDIRYQDIHLEVSAGHNTMIAMCGQFQKEFEHEVPKETKVKNTRYNLTIRAMAV